MTDVSYAPTAALHSAVTGSDRPEDVPERVDVVVIGAGPAGSTAARVLSAAGRSVLVLERRQLPRFHIGESQLPYTCELLDQLGALDEVARQGYPVKKGAEFVFPDGDFRRTDFRDQGPGRRATTYQVERGHFDHLLAGSARAAGALLVESAMVHDLLTDDDGRMHGVRFEAGGRSFAVTARHVIDAGGRASRIAHQYRTRREIPWLRNVAVFRHFTGLDESRNPGHEGDIQIGGHADGWIWAIPIWPDTISVGAVMPRAVLKAAGSPEQVFEEHLARTPRIVERLEGTMAADGIRVESDYCYYSDQVTGPGWSLAGDAGCFIDPIFSGGTMLAVATGTQAGRTVDRILDEPAREEHLQKQYADLYRTGYDSYCRLISAYYESEYKLGKYLAERGFAIDGDPAFARILSGDFWSDVNPVVRWLREQHRWDTFAPFDRVVQCPVYPDLDAAEREAAALSTA